MKNIVARFVVLYWGKCELIMNTSVIVHRYMYTEGIVKYSAVYDMYFQIQMLNHWRNVFFILFFFQWYIQSTCATQGSGLYEGLDWLSNELSNQWKTARD